MGDIREPDPVLLLVAASSRTTRRSIGPAVESSETTARSRMVSDAFDFTETDYYAADDGRRTQEAVSACQRPIDPGRLARIKLRDQCVGGGIRGARTGIRSRGRLISIPATSRAPSWCSLRQKTMPIASISATESMPK